MGAVKVAKHGHGPRRRTRGWSAEKRAKFLAELDARIAAREAADPTHGFRVLFSWANPAAVKAAQVTRIENGRVVGLSQHHEMLRRCFVLQAWCAQKLGWRPEVRAALFAARTQRRLARAARKEGR